MEWMEPKLERSGAELKWRRAERCRAVAEWSLE
jgi:hypothetical protein